MQRQVLYNETDIGFSKTQKTIERLQKQNSEITFIGYQQNLSSINALEIIKQYDLIIDGTDNFPTRYLINDACTLLDKPFVYGSIFQYEGQVSVFNVETENGRSTNYRDLFPQPPKAGSIPNCADGGVLGVLPGIIGTLQALEAIKLITCIDETLVNKLYLFNALNFTSHKIKIQKNSNNTKIKKLIEGIPQQKHVLLEFSNARLIDHTVLEYVYKRSKEYNRLGGNMELVGLDVHTASSAHPWSIHVHIPKRKIRLSRRQQQIQAFAHENNWTYQAELNWRTWHIERYGSFASSTVE